MSKMWWKCSYALFSKKWVEIKSLLRAVRLCKEQQYGKYFFYSVGHAKMVHDICTKMQHITEKCLSAAWIWFIKSKNSSIPKGVLHFLSSPHQKNVVVSTSRNLSVGGEHAQSPGYYCCEDKECTRNYLDVFRKSVRDLGCYLFDSQPVPPLPQFSSPLF